MLGIENSNMGTQHTSSTNSRSSKLPSTKNLSTYKVHRDCAEGERSTNYVGERESKHRNPM